MGFLNWLFRKSPRPALPGEKKYEYPTGNLELQMRVQRGEFLQAIIDDIKPKWTPGNEHLWDEYDPESLLDTPEKCQHMVNFLLFGRLTVFRALRAAGRNLQGRDPFDLQDQVPEVMVQLRKRFPDVFGSGPRRPVQVAANQVKLAPGDPWPGPTGPPK